MSADIPKTHIREALAYLIETSGQHFADESGLKTEVQASARRGYDTALEHLAYALNLPASVHQVADDSLPVYRRLRQRFPDPAAGRRRVYRGERVRTTDAGYSAALPTASDVRVFVNDMELSPEASLAVYSHSTTGFNWEYAGSGPRQLALALLLDYYGDKSMALQLSGEFNQRVTSRFNPDQDWTLTGGEIEEVCAAIENGLVSRE